MFARVQIVRDATTQVLARGAKLCNFVEWREYKLVYRRYASLYFCVGCDVGDNELLALEAIHLYVEILDRYFGNVCELGARLADAARAQGALTRLCRPHLQLPQSILHFGRGAPGWRAARVKQAPDPAHRGRAGYARAG